MTQEQKQYLKEALQRSREIEIKCNTILAKANYKTELYQLTAHKRKLSIECSEYIERVFFNGMTKHESLISQQKKLL